jgi:hypothetical protein
VYYDVGLASVRPGTPLKDDNVVQHCVCGEPMRVPSICYRSPEETWEIINHFIQTQEPLNKFQWVTLGNIDYPYE